MPKTTEELQALLESCRHEPLLAFFADASEGERRGLAKAAEAWAKKIKRNRVVQTGKNTWSGNPLLSGACLAALATCSFSTIKSLNNWWDGGDDVVRVLADRRPEWLADFVEYTLEDPRPVWWMARKLMRAGLCGRPKHDNYVRLMTGHHSGVGGFVFDRSPNRKLGGWAIMDHLLAEPDLQEDVWRLFEIDGGGDSSLAAHDKYTHQKESRWDQSLVEMSRRGIFSRERLLDASLAALERGFPQFRAAWFSAFHELLEPTAGERVARQEEYLRLLASPIPPTVTFALEAIEKIDAAQPLAAKTMLPALRPLMLARSKGTAKAGLKLLERAARREAKQAGAAALVAAEALRHAAADVQSAALKLIESIGSPSDPKLAAAVEDSRQLVAASLRDRVTKWLDSTAATAASKKDDKASGKSKTGKASVGSKESAAPKGDFKALEKRAAKLPEAWRKLVGVDAALAALQSGTFSITAAPFDGSDIPRLDPTRAIEPITKLDDLIDLAAATIESPESADDIERICDAVSRLCADRPADFERRTGPLLKRARDIAERRHIRPFRGHGIPDDQLGLVFAWLLPDALPEQGDKYDRLANLLCAGLSGRMKQLAARVQRREATATLCAPTHAGGWIDPRVLVARAAEVTALKLATDYEKALALLRLAPGHRAEALAALPRSKDEFIAALKHALGGKTAIGETAWLWAAAARARSAWEDDDAVERRHPNLGPDAARAARAEWETSVRPEWMEKYKITVKHRSLDLQLTPPFSDGEVDPRLLAAQAWDRHKDRFLIGFDSGSIRMAWQIWPAAHEAINSLGALGLGDNLEWSEAHWANRTYLEPLVDPDLPLRPMTLLLLSLGLACKDSGEHGLAIDAAITAIADGRLDGEMLGAVLAKLPPTAYVICGRWAKTLTVVAAASPLHAAVIQAALARSLRGDPTTYPKDLQSLVTLLRELVAETKLPIDDPAREFLGQIEGSSKVAKMAKAILAAKGSADSEQTQALLRVALEGRLARAERWMAR